MQKLPSAMFLAIPTRPGFVWSDLNSLLRISMNHRVAYVIRAEIIKKVEIVGETSATGN